jgi:hypothetical protein
MTEAEWLECTNPEPMLKSLRGKASDRKARLFIVACCRYIWHRLTDSGSREVVEIAELHADHGATMEDLEAASEAAFEGFRENTSQYVRDTVFYVAQTGDCLATPEMERIWDVGWTMDASWSTSMAAAEDLAEYGAWNSARDLADKDLAALIRDIVGNPFRELPTIAPSWLFWHEEYVVKLAKAIYDERAFDRLPILADALEDASCGNPEILAHCRGPGPHVRGCWVVDLILGKE